MGKVKLSMPEQADNMLLLHTVLPTTLNIILQYGL
jgi:hypothetical protein